jgi:hypothetical protein
LNGHGRPFLLGAGVEPLGRESKQEAQLLYPQVCSDKPHDETIMRLDRLAGVFGIVRHWRGG